MRGFAFIGVFLLIVTVLAGCLDPGTGPVTGDPAAYGEVAFNETALGYTVPVQVEGGASFDAALEVEPAGLYGSNLTGGAHYYRFHVEQGDPINIEIRPFCNTHDCPVITAGAIGVGDAERRLSFRLLSPDGLLLDTPNSNPGDSRVTLDAAPVAGEYRFLVTEEHGGFTGEYQFCFLVPPPGEHPCPDYGLRDHSIIYGGSLGKAKTNVLLFPPPHGDLGNPEGPTVLDYLEAAIFGIHEWVDVLHQFAEDYPEYDYLRQITVDIQIFDGVQDPAEYDITIAYVPGGPQFRGAATACVDPPRCIVLSLFSASPRAGQLTPDFPTFNDLEAVTKHEFAHVWGLGHSLTWTKEYGPDLMNSPATFVYGDGDPAGDGGVPSPKQCISTLNLYGMALIFGFLNEGHEEAPEGWGMDLPTEYELPEDMPYEWYCNEDASGDEEGIQFHPNLRVRDPTGLLQR
jgi:hypothetical protein